MAEKWNKMVEAFMRALKRPSNKEAGRAFDDLTEARMNKNLQEDFDQAFEEAVERRKAERLNEWDWDGKPENQMGDDWDYNAAKDRDAAAEQQARDEIIKALQKNTDRDVTDVLRDFGYIFEE